MGVVYKRLRLLEFCVADFPENRKMIYSKPSRMAIKQNLYSCVCVREILVRISEFAGRDLLQELDLHHFNTGRTEGAIGRSRRILAKLSAMDADRILMKEAMKFKEVTDPRTPIQVSKTPRSHQFYRKQDVNEKKKFKKMATEKVQELKELIIKNRKINDEWRDICYGKRIRPIDMQLRWDTAMEKVTPLFKMFNSVRAKSIRTMKYMVTHSQVLHSLFITSEKKTSISPGLVPYSKRGEVMYKLKKKLLDAKEHPIITEQLDKFRNCEVFKERSSSRELSLDIETVQYSYPKKCGCLCLVEMETKLTFVLHIKRDKVPQRLTTIHGLSVASLENCPKVYEVVDGLDAFFHVLNADEFIIGTWNGTALDIGSFAGLYAEVGESVKSNMRFMDFMFIDRGVRRLKGEKKAKFRKQSVAFNVFGCTIPGKPVPNWHKDVEADAQACMEIMLCMLNDQEFIDPTFHSIRKIGDKLLYLENISYGKDSPFDLKSDAEDAMKIYKEEYQLFDVFVGGNEGSESTNLQSSSGTFIAEVLDVDEELQGVDGLNDSIFGGDDTSNVPVTDE